jgi:hypothetical protein
MPSFGVIRGQSSVAGSPMTQCNWGVIGKLLICWFQKYIHVGIRDLLLELHEVKHHGVGSIVDPVGVKLKVTDINMYYIYILLKSA